MRVPASVRVAQVILCLECVFVILVGVLAVIVGKFASESQVMKLFGLTHKDAHILAVTLIVLGIVLIVVGLLIVWPTILLGKLSRVARMVITILMILGLLGDLLNAFGAQTSTNRISGLIGMILDLIVVYCLWWNPNARLAFAQS